MIENLYNVILIVAQRRQDFLYIPHNFFLIYEYPNSQQGCRWWAFMKVRNLANLG